MPDSRILNVSLDTGETVPDDNPAAGTYHVLIGSWSVAGTPGKLIPHNDRHGPIDATICPDPFTNPVTFHLSLG